MYLLFLLLIASTSYADISQLRTYPSEITITFDALEVIKIPEKASARERKRYEAMTPEMISYERFIRVVNALVDDGDVNLEFYDKNDRLLEQKAITNSSQPSPKYIFFMDRDSGRKFNGVRDVYMIPDNAHYFQIVVRNGKEKHIATHPDFQNSDKVLISQYEGISAIRKVMMQVELLGTKTNITTRLGLFHFPRL